MAERRTRKAAKSLWDDPRYAEQRLKDWARRASNGDKAAAKNISEILAERPQFRSVVPQLSDLATRTEACWIEATALGDPLAESAVRDEVNVLKAELLGPTPSSIDRILVSNVVVAYLANKRALLLATRPAQSPAIATWRDRQLEATQRRLFLACRALKLIQGKSPNTSRLFEKFFRSKGLTLNN